MTHVIVLLAVSMIDLYLFYQAPDIMVTGDIHLLLKFQRILINKDTCTSRRKAVKIHCNYCIQGINVQTTVCVSFVDKPEDVSAIEGQQAVLSCVLSNYVIEDVSWWKGLNKMASSSDDATEGNRLTMSSAKVLDMRMFSLIISDVELQDEGDYHCEVDLQESEPLKSGSAHLTVLQAPSPDYPQCFTSKESFNVDSSVTLSCLSEHINPPVELSWIDDDGNVIYTTVQSNIQGRYVYKNLTFNAKKSDSKNKFTCKQTSQVLREPSNCTVVDLNIYYKPDIKIQHTDIIYVGSDAILFCQSFANPPVMQYKWISRPKLDGDEYTTNGQVFRLLRPTVDHNGTQITCLGKNIVGETSQTVVLHISDSKRGSNSEHNKDDKNIHVSNDLDLITSRKDHNNSQEETSRTVSLYVVIIIIVLVVIVVVVVVVIPVYYQCFCKTRTATDSSGREIYQPTVYYDTRDRTSNSGLYDRSLPRLPSTGHYGHWRHSFASQVPEDLEQQGYMYIEERNGQNTL
ncbi:kin of IRRE-like protein 1 isoform X1 [Anneissia japonica]|uniref:kin of IRRE-like protein 1 isoform X1 n=1 Tax=Anneissia japonica TaxID=1529436 RepID=UPI001425B83D|nr:kin of IRRE-like protein 1 isoform X1 [Anneissia japonica]XP_033118813.1 kin of IRRE-like protein 1 isoform X1 [Anneissia japonica]XP_033118814.1 kin of IRRE-like protein 1 isoform X1 [Anneissia japonica]